MKQLNFLSSLGSQSMGLRSVTLASTVGSPSAHRRGIMLRLLSVLVLIFTIGVGQMWADTKSFDKTGFSSSDKTETKAPITVTFDEVTINNQQIRFSSGKKMVVSAASGYSMSEISVVTNSSETYISPLGNSVSTGTWSKVSATNYRWTGSATSVTFTPNSACRITTVTVTYAATASCTTNPTVSAGGNSSVTSTTATVTCSSGISSLGSTGCSISGYGFVIGTSANPSIGGSGVTKHEVGTTYTTTGTSFSKNLTGLSPTTTYYVRPYATNGNGTAYGTQTSFTTPALPRYKITYNAGTGTCETTSWTQPSYEASTTLPTATPPATCSGWAFEGWCTSSAGDAANNTTSPGTILKGSYTPTGDITLYAVYTKSENSSTPTTESYGFESTDDDTNWEFSGVEANTGYHKTGSKAGKIARSSTGNSTITFKNKVNVTAFSFQFMRQTTNNNYNVYIETSTDKSSWSAVETYAMSSFTSAETWYAKSHDFDGKTALYVRIKCYTTSAIRWVDDISITYTGGSTTYYMTSLVCCSPLGSINGSFFWPTLFSYLTC